MKQIIVKTSAIAETLKVLEFLRSQDDEQMAYVVGAPGTGKTSTAKYLAMQYRGIYYRTLTNQGQFGLVKGLLGAIDNSTCRSAAEGMIKLINVCQEKQCALFIDEVEKLNYTHLETLRDIHDESQVPVFLFGTKIHDCLSEHPQICDRTHFHRLSVPTFQDAKAMAKRVGNEKYQISIADDLLDSIYRNSTMLRQIKRSLAYIEAEAIVNQWTVVDAALWGDRPLLPDLYSMPDDSVRVRLTKTK
jgi:DNA transposition AAA+ family ATPase